MSEPSDSPPGLWGTAKRLMDALLAIAENRLELFAVELQEEKCRAAESFLLLAAVAALGAMTLGLLTFTIVVLFWESGRLAALLGLNAAYLAGTLFAWRALQKRLRTHVPFAGTIGELKKDRECLKREK